jgi:adenylate cyclase
MCAYLADLHEHGRQVQFRFGINSGPVVGGVIGQEKFHYDVWGDAVNVASRMESHGIPERIQVTPATHALLDGKFDFEPHGRIEVKGVGEMDTWLLIGRRVGSRPGRRE